MLSGIGKLKPYLPAWCCKSTKKVLFAKAFSLKNEETFFTFCSLRASLEKARRCIPKVKADVHLKAVQLRRRRAAPEWGEAAAFFCRLPTERIHRAAIGKNLGTFCENKRTIPKKSCAFLTKWCTFLPCRASPPEMPGRAALQSVQDRRGVAFFCRRMVSEKCRLGGVE